MDQSKKNVNIIPEYAVIKKAILGEFYFSKNALTQYDLKPNIQNEQKAREQLISLARSLAFKSYVLKEEKLKNWFSLFLARPYNFNNFSLHAVFSICHLIMELSGLTKIENEGFDNDMAYSEV